MPKRRFFAHFGAKDVFAHFGSKSAKQLLFSHTNLQGKIGMARTASTARSSGSLGVAGTPRAIEEECAVGMYKCGKPPRSGSAPNTRSWSSGKYPSHARSSLAKNSALKLRMRSAWSSSTAIGQHSRMELADCVCTMFAPYQWPPQVEQRVHALVRRVDADLARHHLC